MVLPRKYTEVGELSISKSSNRYMKNRISGLKKKKEKKIKQEKACPDSAISSTSNPYSSTVLLRGTYLCNN